MHGGIIARSLGSVQEQTIDLRVRRRRSAKARGTRLRLRKQVTSNAGSADGSAALDDRLFRDRPLGRAQPRSRACSLRTGRLAIRAPITDEIAFPFRCTMSRFHITPVAARSIALVASLLLACQGGTSDAGGESGQPPEGTSEAVEASGSESGTGDGAGPGTAGTAAPADLASGALADGTGVPPTASAEAPEPDITAADGHGPLSPEAHAIFWGSVEDPPAEELMATRRDLYGRHYLTCDENNHHLMYDRLQNLGGAYAGVGSDQAYMFMGWMRPNLAWVTDYDPWIRHLHWAYHAFFRASEDPESVPRVVGRVPGRRRRSADPRDLSRA